MAAAIATHVHQWAHHDACLFMIPGTGPIDPSGAHVPTIEKILEFHYNPTHGSFATLVCEGTHNAESVIALRHAMMAPGLRMNLFISRYDALPNFTTANGTLYHVRHTVHNLRARVHDFRELQTQICIDHETGRTDVKKIMKFVFEDVGPMEPAHVSSLSALASTVSTTAESAYFSTTSVSTSTQSILSLMSTSWTPEVSTIAMLSTLRAAPITRTS